MVGALLIRSSRRNSRRSFFGVAEIFAQNAGRVGEVDHIIAEEQIVLNDVPNEAAEKGDVATGANRHPDIGQRARARKSGDRRE